MRHVITACRPQLPAVRAAVTGLARAWPAGIPVRACLRGFLRLSADV